MNGNLSGTALRRIFTAGLLAQVFLAGCAGSRERGPKVITNCPLKNKTAEDDGQPFTGTHAPPAPGGQSPYYPPGMTTPPGQFAPVGSPHPGAAGAPAQTVSGQSLQPYQQAYRLTPNGWQ